MISFIVACFVVVSPVHAAQSVPYKMNFQGRLTNASGTALTGTYDVELKLYTLASGGTFVWGETRTAGNGNAVTVTNGLFSILIGEGTAVAGSSATLQAAIAANQTLFLEVKVGTETLTPRNQLGSSAFAVNSDMVDGIDGASIAQLGIANAFTGAQSITVGSTNAFQVKNGTNLFNVNTTDSIITLGVSDTTGSVLVLDTKSDSGDPTGTKAVAGAMYYNSNANKFRCYQNTGWTDCITTSTLQTAYNVSTGGTTPMIKLDSTRDGVFIQDADTTIGGTLFGVNQSNASGLGTSLFSVSNTGAVSLGLAGTVTTLPGNISSTGTISATGATALFKPSSSVANAFQIQDSASLVMFSADTSAKVVRIGSTSTADTTVLLVLDYDSADPTGVNGGQYYNSTNNKFRCYQGGVWMDCGNGFNTVTKAADQIATQSSTTFQDDNTLYFNANANTTYVFDAWIPVNDTNATADLKYTFTIPTSATISAITSYNSATATLTSCNITSSGQTCAVTANNANLFIQVKGSVTVAGTAGTVRFRFAQNGAAAVNYPLVKKGATLSWHQSN